MGLHQILSPHQLLDVLPPANTGLSCCYRSMSPLTLLLLIFSSLYCDCRSYKAHTRSLFLLIAELHDMSQPSLRKGTASYRTEPCLANSRDVLFACG